ncbi:MAG: Kelch repeat-containing protein [Pleomorphochaeta sp.]
MKNKIILFLVITLFLISCDGQFIIPFDEFTYAEYDGSLETKELISDAPWSNREDFASVVFKDQIWVLGGYNRSQRGDEDCYKEDIYKSSDGINWDLVSDSAPWKGKRGISAVATEDYICIFGGFTVDEKTGDRRYNNDLWYSEDGIKWEKAPTLGDIKPHARSEYGMVYYDGNIYVFGGFCQIKNEYEDGYKNGPNYFNDIWQYNIANNKWTEINSTMPGKRAAFGYCVDDNGIIYIQGGTYYEALQSRRGNFDPDVYNWGALWSFDTKSIATATSEIEWSALDTLQLKKDGAIDNARLRARESKTREKHSLSFYDNKIWLFAGKSNSSLSFSHEYKNYSTFYYDLNSTNADNNYKWIYDSEGAPMDPRFGYSTVTFDDKIFILGGYSNSGPQNDVYSLSKKKDN